MKTLKSTSSANEIDGSPFDDFGFNYLWRLHHLENYVPAFSKEVELKLPKLKKVGSGKSPKIKLPKLKKV